MNANKQDAGGEVTNPDNVGGLNDHKPVPLSEELRIEAAMISGDVYVRGDAFVARMTRMAEQAERLEELCRAAPAGGDVPFDTVRSVCRALTRLGHTTPESQEEQAARAVELVDTLCREVQSHFDSLRSAPAGSGEVEQMAKRLDDAREIEEETSGLEDTIDAMRTAAALLRKLQQGAEYVMVPRVPTDEMETAHRMYGDTSDWWQAVIAASQGQEGGHARD